NDVSRIIRGINNNNDMLDTRHAALDNVSDLLFLSSQLIENLKAHKGHSKSNIDFSGIALFYADAGGIDFSGVDVSRSTFSFVDLSNARLTPASMVNFDVTNSNWWDAAEVDQNLLQWLLANRYPGYADPEVISSPTKITKDYY